MRDIEIVKAHIELQEAFEQLNHSDVKSCNAILESAARGGGGFCPQE